MRRVVSMLFALALTACGGGNARTVLLPGSSSGAAPTNVSGAPAVGTNGIGLSITAIRFTDTGWHAMRVVKTTWRDASRKTAISSDSTVVTVSPPYQLASWTASNTFTASYYVTPIGPGTATITFSDHDGAESAQLAVTVVAPPTGTLYVAGVDEVDAFPSAANGTTEPQRRITGFFIPPPPRSDGGAPIAIGTGVDGTVYVARDRASGPSTSVCEVFPESPTANGSGIGIASLPCGTYGSAVAGEPSGGFDILTGSATGGAQVLRYDRTGATSTLTVSTDVVNPEDIAIDANGNVFVSENVGPSILTGRVLEYCAGAVGSTAPMRTITAVTGEQFGAIAVAPDGTLYVRSIPAITLNNSSVESIRVFASGATSSMRTLGPFTTDAVGGLAVDKGGELYVGLNGVGTGRWRVDVYAPDATGTATPVRSIPNPLPLDSVGGRAIVGIALGPAAPPPPDQVLSRSRAR